MADANPNTLARNGTACTTHHVPQPRLSRRNAFISSAGQSATDWPAACIVVWLVWVVVITNSAAKKLSWSRLGKSHESRPMPPVARRAVVRADVVVGAWP